MINKQLELTEKQNKCYYNHTNCPNKNYGILWSFYIRIGVE